MLDAPLRKLIDRPFAMAAAQLARFPVSATGLTVAGFAAGLAAIGCIATHRPAVGLAFIVLNRLLAGLDGPLARRTRVTDLGAYLDIVFDAIFYAGVPFAFALADPTRALAACFLILSFVGAGTAHLAHAIFAEKRGHSNCDPRGPAEGIETFIAFALACLLPDWFSVIAYAFGALCFATTGMRVAAAVASLK